MRNYLRNSADYVIAAVVFLLMIAGTALVIHINNKNTYKGVSDTRFESGTYSAYSDDIYKIEQPKKDYPAPAKEQRSFYRTYSEGQLQYSIDRGNTNVPHNPDIGPSSFYVNLYNSRNEAVTISGDQLKTVTFGCVALLNPYRVVPVSVETIELGPFEHTKRLIEVDATCVYIGTADGKYFWKL